MVLEGGYDEEGRGFQVYLIAKELEKCVLKLGVTALELPAEPAFQVGVGEPAGHPLFEGEGLVVGKLDGGWVPDQAADVQEHFRRRLFLAEVDVLPLGDKLFRAQPGLGGHHGSCLKSLHLSCRQKRGVEDSRPNP